MDSSAVIAACNNSLCLPSHADILGKLYGKLIKLPVVDSAPVHIGNNRSFAQNTAPLVPLGKGHVCGGGGFKDKGKIGFNVKCSRSCASESDLLLRLESKCAVIGQGIFKYHCKHYCAACTVINGFGADNSVPFRIAAGEICIISERYVFFSIFPVLCTDVDVKTVEFRGSLSLLLGHIVNGAGAYRAHYAVFKPYLSADNSICLNAADAVYVKCAVSVYARNNKPHFICMSGYHQL